MNVHLCWRRRHAALSTWTGSQTSGPAQLLSASWFSVRTGPSNLRRNVVESFDTIFLDHQCHSIYRSCPRRAEYIESLEEQNLKIINTPAVTLSNPIITLEPSYWADVVMEQAQEAPDIRWKPFLATVRGMGGGKTRALEEIRFELLGRPGVLPLAFTFNTTMDFDPAEFMWSSEPRVCYALSVVARLAAVFYGLPMPSVRKLLKPNSPWGEGKDDNYPLELIRGFLVHAVKKAPNSPSTVVVLADEVFKSETDFASKFKLNSRADRDITSVLRRAVLDVKITEGLDTALVISSLTIDAVGKTTSGRKVTPLVLHNLDDQQIVRDWWGKVDKEQASLLQLSAALDSLPRLVEFAAVYLKKHPGPVNAQKVVDLLQFVKNRIREMYEPSMLSKEELRALVFGEEVDLDERVMDLIKFSLFTNSLTKFTYDKAEKIIPEASLMLLAAGAGDKPGTHADLLRDFLVAMQTGTEGAPLEWATHWWLRMRFAVILGEQDFKLEKFLGLHDTHFDRDAESNQSTSQLDKLCAIHFNVPARLDRIVRSRRLARSNKNLPAFIGDLCNRKMAPGDVLLFESPDEERFDFLLAVCDHNGPFLVFLDDKSRKIEADSKPETGQAEYVAESIIPAAQAANAPAGSLAKALADERYVFLFVTSYPGQSYTQDNAIVLMKKETKRFLGPMWGVYRAVRGGFS
eukprot:gb/GEZN01003015.1/.p1 GENE.gb/GEZN01003015.1/~~gb/GEZN01003015.1/.p1  ORF type:complete len:689 (+),score=86.12 gb/GEZN01003015.1/:102-2168(+)